MSCFAEHSGAGAASPRSQLCRRGHKQAVGKSGMQRRMLWRTALKGTGSRAVHQWQLCIRVEKHPNAMSPRDAQPCLSYECIPPKHSMHSTKAQHAHPQDCIATLSSSGYLTGMYGASHELDLLYVVCKM